MIEIGLGLFTIVLGAKAFTPSGLPLNSTSNLTGPTAKVIGVVCVLLGLFFTIDGMFGITPILAWMR